MAKYTINRLNRNERESYTKWKILLMKAYGMTIFHDPNFLSYHDNKYNEHHLAVYKGQTIIGVMPMAIVRDGVKNVARSPYGASYGGFVFSSVLTYSESKGVVDAFIAYMKDLEVNGIILTPPLDIYYSSYSDTFVFALLERGFRLINSDITSVVPLISSDLENTTYTSRARNMYKKAKNAGIIVKEKANLNEFWPLMDKTFMRHGINPTHTKEELGQLIKLCPEDISFDIAVLQDRPIAGICYFKINELVNMSFYLCSDSDYRDYQGMSFLVYQAILNSQAKGFRYFDFGTSSVNMVARENIFLFKESFGAIGKFRNTYNLDLNV